MNFLQRLFSFVTRHENLCFLLLFALFIVFVDGNSLWERHYVWERTLNLKNEIKNYEMRYKEDSLKLNELKTKPERLEQVAREKYLMTRPGEDVFVIEEGKSNSYINNNQNAANPSVLTEKK